MTAQPQVLIVGAGFSGIGVAAALRKAGIEDFLLVDDGDGYGGTWNWNRYPGVAVDIPSFSYQYSFAKRTTWSRVYAPGEELRDYAEHCAERFGLRPRTRFGTHVSEATFDEDAHAWRLRTDEGEPIEARYVIDASGVLTVPKMPDIEGLDAVRRRHAAHLPVEPLPGPARQAGGGDRHRRIGRAGDPGDRSRGRAPDRVPAHADLVPAEARRAASGLGPLDP